MAILDILLYPNPVLREKCRPVSSDEVQSEAFQQLIDSMIETLYAKPGTVGLAAPQVGHPVQLFVLDATAKTTCDRLFVLINPVITQQSNWKYSREGCLSFPQYIVTVKRARKLAMTWMDRSGQLVNEQFTDFEAIIAQHELDHLSGILFIDRVRNIDTDIIERTMALSP